MSFWNAPHIIQAKKFFDSRLLGLVEGPLNEGDKNRLRMHFIDAFSEGYTEGSTIKPPHPDYSSAIKQPIPMRLTIEMASDYFRKIGHIMGYMVGALLSNPRKITLQLKEHIALCLAFARNPVFYNEFIKQNLNEWGRKHDREVVALRASSPGSADIADSNKNAFLHILPN